MMLPVFTLLLLAAAVALAWCWSLAIADLRLRAERAEALNERSAEAIKAAWARADPMRVALLVLAEGSACCRDCGRSLETHGHRLDCASAQALGIARECPRKPNLPADEPWEQDAPRAAAEQDHEAAEPPEEDAG